MWWWKSNIYIPVTLSDQTEKLHNDLLNYGYDLFNPNDSFYQDIYTPYTFINGTDVLLSDRKQSFLMIQKLLAKKDANILVIQRKLGI